MGDTTLVGCAEIAELCAGFASAPGNGFAFTWLAHCVGAMTRFHDTIAALATPIGVSAVALVRVSGPDTVRILESALSGAPLPRQVRRGDYRDSSGTLLDDVLFVFYPAPKSYTAEDSLEITCHGNPFIVQKILEDLYARGCRPAEPGEFTQRAFVNGRMDLSQAEAVADLIHAQGDRALSAANQQLRGGLSRRIALMINEVLGVLARVEAYIDFPDEDLPAEDASQLRKDLECLLRQANELLATGHYGNLLREGIRTVILGAPNVGKSSLLNRLIGRDRALVSSEPGTTRDFIEERIVLGGYCLRLIDTAGLNTNPQFVEKLGIQKTMECAEEADLVLAVVDATRPVVVIPPELAGFIKTGRSVIVVNKSDVDPSASVDQLPAGVPIVRISAATGFGIRELVALITHVADGFRPDESRDVTTINARHAHALAQVVRGLQAALTKIGTSSSGDLVASDLRDALGGLESIGGKVDNERMLDQLFASFCIGK